MRTVATHAVHNGLTHLPLTIHGGRLCSGIPELQLRLEEMLQKQAGSCYARQQ